MTKWDYSYIHIDPSSEAFERRFNELGGEGWEFVQLITGYDEDGDPCYTAIFKRSRRTDSDHVVMTAGGRPIKAYQRGHFDRYVAPEIEMDYEIEPGHLVTLRGTQKWINEKVAALQRGEPL